MASTFTTSLGLEIQATGENRASWGAKTNTNLSLVEEAISGLKTIAMADADMTLTKVNAGTDQSRPMFLRFTGTLTAGRTVTIPTVSKFYFMQNSTGGSFDLTISTGSSTFVLAPSQWKLIFTDGANLWSSDNLFSASSASRRWDIIGAVDASGNMEIGKAIDFHNTNADATDFAVRLETGSTTTDLYVTPAGGPARKSGIRAMTGWHQEWMLIFLMGCMPTRFMSIRPMMASSMSARAGDMGRGRYAMDHRCQWRCDPEFCREYPSAYQDHRSDPDRRRYRSVFNECRMTIAASGPLRIENLGNEYGWAPDPGPWRMSHYRRGHASRLVRANSGNNGAVNGSAGVPTSGPLRMAHFRGQSKGWTFTNSSVRINNYYPHGEFGDDWLGANGTGWPCFFINNNGIYSNGTSWYALIIYARLDNGPFTFTNNSEIQGGGGPPNSNPGQHAVYVYNSGSVYANRPIIVNNHAIRGGGGAGGVGGTGGTGGTGYYIAQEGPVYGETPDKYQWYRNVDSNYHGVWWANQNLWESAHGIPAAASVVLGAYTYYRHTLMSTAGSTNRYQIYRQWAVYVGGAGGGAGGNGGRGIGYNSPNQGGKPGAGGGNNGGNSGVGGSGGYGGTGGSWGQNGQTGATGNTGAGGNAGGGYGGAAGGGGGAAGYSVYAASAWGFANYNTIQGPYGGGVANT